MGIFHIFSSPCLRPRCFPRRQQAGIMNVGARNCRDLFSLQRSYNGLTRRTSLLSLRPRRVRGLPFAACCHVAVTTAVGCLPERQQPPRKESTGSNIGYQIPSVGASMGEKLSRALRRLARALQLLLRALGISLLFSTPVVSGAVVYVLHRSPGFPRGISTQLCDWWWRLLLGVVDRSGPTFIKVTFFSIPGSVGTQQIRCADYAPTWSRGCTLVHRNVWCMPLSACVVDEPCVPFFFDRKGSSFLRTPKNAIYLPLPRPITLSGFSVGKHSARHFPESRVL